MNTLDKAVSNIPTGVSFHNSPNCVLNVMQDVITIQLTSRQTGNAYSMYEHTIQPGFGSPLHTHLHTDEMAYVLSSTFEFRCGNCKFEIPTGGFILLPRGREHSFRNMARLTGKLLVIVSPPGLDYFWQDMTQFAAGQPLNMELMNEIYHQHGMQLLGTPQQP